MMISLSTASVPAVCPSSCPDPPLLTPLDHLFDHGPSTDDEAVQKVDLDWQTILHHPPLGLDVSACLLQSVEGLWVLAIAAEDGRLLHCVPLLDVSSEIDEHLYPPPPSKH